MSLRVGYLNYADSATITTSPTAAGGAASYVQNDSRGDALVTTLGTQDILLTWGGAAKTISELAFWRCTGLAYNDTIQETFYPNADWTGSPLYNPSATNAYAATLFDDWGWQFVNRYYTAVPLVKSVRIRIVSAAALTISRLYLGPYTEASWNPNYGLSVTWENNDVQSRSNSGSLRSLAKADWRVMTFDMGMKTEADRAVWLEVARYMRSSYSGVFSVFPGSGGTVERDHTVFGKFQKPPGLKLSDVSRYDMSVTVQGI